MKMERLKNLMLLAGGNITTQLQGELKKLIRRGRIALIPINKNIRSGLSYRKERGFTLIELLVVMAIISILASFTLPALRSARIHAHRINDLSNLRQLQMAWLMYVQDNDGFTPTFIPGHTHRAWVFQLYKYYLNQDIVRSPFMASPFGDRVPDEVIREFIATGDILNTDPGRTYLIPLFSMAVFPVFGYNEHGWTPHWNLDGSPASGAGLRLIECINPSDTIVFGTSRGMGTVPNSGWYRLTPYRELTFPDPGVVLWSGAPPLTQSSFGGLSPHWLGKANISFADGRVETLDPAFLTDVGMWDPRRR